MRKNVCLLLVAIAVTILYTGCRKIDFKFKDPVRNCKILTIDEDRDGLPLHRTVTYDAAGYPISVRYREDEEGTGNPEFKFVYDSQHRLIAWEGFTEHRLFYNSKGQAVIDSVISNYAGQDSRYEEKLYYDLYGRITKVVSKYYSSGMDDPEVGTVTTTLYRYDTRGNLIIDGAQYDNKTCMYRSHPVWMFVHKNYSVNNQRGAQSYNDSGLPLTFGSTNQIFLDKSMALANIVYDCGTGTK